MKSIIHAVCLLVAALTANAQGQFEAMVTYAGTTPTGGTPVSSSIYASINGPIGWTFQSTLPIEVTALGAFDYLVSTRPQLQVGLWDASGTLLASQTIRTASTAVGESRYESIAPLLLMPGQTYFVAAYSLTSPLFAVVVTPDMPPNGYATMSPEIQLGQVAYGSGTGFSFPSTTDGRAGYAIIAPNFEYQPVPEPSVWGLAGLGLAAWARGRRRG